MLRGCRGLGIRAPMAAAPNTWRLSDPYDSGSSTRGPKGCAMSSEMGPSGKSEDVVLLPATVSSRHGILARDDPATQLMTSLLESGG